MVKRDWETGREETGGPARGFDMANFKRVMLLTHDESTFFENNKQVMAWREAGGKATPVKKGQGSSIMVSDFASPELGWLTAQKFDKATG